MVSFLHFRSRRWGGPSSLSQHVPLTQPGSFPILRKRNDQPHRIARIIFPSPSLGLQAPRGAHLWGGHYPTHNTHLETYLVFLRQEYRTSGAVCSGDPVRRWKILLCSVTDDVFLDGLMRSTLPPFKFPISPLQLSSGLEAGNLRPNILVPSDF